MRALTFRVIIFYTLINHHSHRKHGRASGDGPAVAAEAAAPQNLGEPGECGSAADFFSGCLISGRVCFRAMGDGPAVAAEATAPQIGLRAMGDETAVAAEAAASQNLGEPGECGSDANFLADMLKREKNHVSLSPSSRAIPVNDLVLPDDERKPQANKTGHCASSISLNEIPDDHRHEVVGDYAPAVKSGFKGKRATKKFSRYGKRGGEQKRNPLDRLSLSPGPPPSEPRRAPTAGRKITKTQIIKKIGYVTRQCRKAQSEMDAALKDNHRLKRKASKAKEVVDDLRTNLKGARIDVRHCKSVITELKDNHRSSTNATEKKHEHMLNTMRNVANETMKASNDLHASQLESKDNEIMVSQSCVGMDTVEHTVII